MRKRISDGEDWNVREAYSALGRVDGSDTLRGSGWYVVDDEAIADSGMRIPTVKERLEAKTPYAVMDSESAKRSSDLLEQQIAMIQEWREELPVNLSIQRENL